MPGSMFETILDLPPFKGISREELSAILGKMPLEFNQFDPGETIAENNDFCSSLFIILSGRAIIRRTAFDERIAFSQIIGQGSMPGAEKLWGLYNNYDCEITAVTKLSILVIGKAHLMDLLSRSRLILINFLNYLSFRGQVRTENIKTLGCINIKELCRLTWYALGERRALCTTFSASLHDLQSLTGKGKDTLLKECKDLEALIITSKNGLPRYNRECISEKNECNFKVKDTYNLSESHSIQVDSIYKICAYSINTGVDTTDRNANITDLINTNIIDANEADPICANTKDSEEIDSCAIEGNVIDSSGIEESLIYQDFEGITEENPRIILTFNSRPD